MQTRLTQTHKDLPASASQVLGLQVCGTTLDENAHSKARTEKDTPPLPTKQVGDSDAEVQPLIQL